MKADTREGGKKHFLAIFRPAHVFDSGTVEVLDQRHFQVPLAV